MFAKGQASAGQRSNQVRQERAALKGEIKAGMKLDDALSDPRAKDMKLWDFLMASSRFGSKNATDTFRILDIVNPRKTVGELSHRQLILLKQFVTPKWKGNNEANR